MLGEAGIDGWSVLVERLNLDEGHPWWRRFSHKPGALPYNKHGGNAPLRKVWRKPGDYELHHLLDHAPWVREMSLSQPIRDIPKGY